MTGSHFPMQGKAEGARFGKSPWDQVLYFDNFTSSTGLQEMVNVSRIGDAHDFMRLSPHRG
jgi:hypothetical protein